MNDYPTRFIAEFQPDGTDEVRSRVIDNNSDDQFILNAAAWLREMWGNDGRIVIREQHQEHIGWVEVHSYEYELRSKTPSPYDVNAVNDNNAVLGQQETSRKAALATYPRTGTQRFNILMALAHRVVHGMTREEIERHLRLGGNSVHPRVLELIAGGWVEEHKTETRLTTHGQEAVVLRVTRKGLDEARTRGDFSQSEAAVNNDRRVLA